MRKITTTTLLRLTLFSAIGLGFSPDSPFSSHLQRNQPPIAWVELGPDSIRIARAISNQETCPILQLDSKRIQMNVRASSEALKFPVLACEALIPPETQIASIGEQDLILPKGDPQRILILGDTGCRIKSANGNTQIQNCNSLDAWPFRQIAEKAAEWKPDLVIHLGDYLYRETPCPNGNLGCAGSPSGDTWATWNEDFFVLLGKTDDR